MKDHQRAILIGLSAGVAQTVAGAVYAFAERHTFWSYIRLSSEPILGWQLNGRPSPVGFWLYEPEVLVVFAICLLLDSFVRQPANSRKFALIQATAATGTFVIFDNLIIFPIVVYPRVWPAIDYFYNFRPSAGLIDTVGNGALIFMAAFAAPYVRALYLKRKRLTIALAVVVVSLGSLSVLGRALHPGWIVGAFSDRAFDEGERLFEQRQYENAVRSYRTAIRWQQARQALRRIKHPFAPHNRGALGDTRIPNAEFMIANCFFKGGDVDRARALHEAIRDRYAGFLGSSVECRAWHHQYHSISSQPEYVIKRGLKGELTGERYFRPPTGGQRGLLVTNRGHGRVKRAVVFDPAGQEIELEFNTEWDVREWFWGDEVPLEEGQYRFVVEYLDGSVYEGYYTVRGNPLKPTRLIHPEPFETGVSPTPTIRWDPVEGATRYHVDIYDYWGQTKNSVNYHGLHETALTIPPGDLAPDTKYVVQIKAYDAPETFGSLLKTEFTTGPA